MYSESEEGEIVSDFEDFEEELRSLPHVLKFIHKLHDHITKQRKKIDKLQKKFNQKKQQNLLCTKTYVHCGTQTNSLDFNEPLSQGWDVHNVKSLSIVDQVKQVAESALLQTGFVYEQTSGMYYDYKTGYYYDTNQGLYYDGNTGTYYYYDEISKTYQFHSQVHINETTTHLATLQKKEEGTGKMYKDDVKKRKFISEEENSEDKVPEEGECSGSENEGISDEIILDVSTNSDSDDEEQGNMAQ